MGRDKRRKIRLFLGMQVYVNGYEYVLENEESEQQKELMQNNFNKSFSARQEYILLE